MADEAAPDPAQGSYFPTPMRISKRIYSSSFAVFAASCMIGASVHQTANAAVSDEDFNALRQAVEQLSKKVQSLEATHEEDQAKIRKLQHRVSEASVASETPKQASEGKGVTKPGSILNTAVADMSGPLATHNITMVGDAEVQFGKTSHSHGGFVMADFAPIFLYRASDKVLFEAGFDFMIQNVATAQVGNTNGGGYSTTVNLSFATIDYLLNDYMTIVAGNMLLPLGTYSERGAGWLNKVPDDPMARDLLPGSGVGVQIRGAIPIGQKGGSLTYAVFTANGPGSLDGSGRAGQLDLGGNVGLTLAGNTANNHGGMGYGGRIGYFYPWKPQHDVEIGISGMSSPWDNAGNRNYSAGVADVAMHFGPNVEIKGEYIHSWYGTDDMGTIKPSGWWVQGGYKLAGIAPSATFVKDVEIVGRYDTISDGMGTRTNRGTIGAVYYLTNTLWLEGAYEWSRSRGPNPAPSDQVIFQLSYGF
jgi:hypothetical protein